jgi:hypothetical protein
LLCVALIICVKTLARRIENNITWYKQVTGQIQIPDSGIVISKTLQWKKNKTDGRHPFWHGFN